MSLNDKINLKRKAISIVFICVQLIVLLFSLSGCSIGHPQNGLTANINTAYHWFSDTGIDVKAFNGRIYDILQAPNGTLFYSTSAEMSICPVYSADGTIMTDINELKDLLH